MRLLRPSIALASVLLLAPLASAPAGAARADQDRPPRTQGSVTDARGDATGPAKRAPRADLLKVRYRMPLPRNSRMLSIDADLVKVGFGRVPGSPFPDNAPRQQVKTFLDGPGARDWAITFYNYDRSPRVVYLGDPSGKPRQVRWGLAVTGVGTGGGQGTMSLSISTEWLRGPERVNFTSQGISGRANDVADTVERLNTKYSGRNRSNTIRLRGDTGCETDAATTRCVYRG